AGSGQVGRREVPVHQVPEVFQVLGTGIAVVDVVGVFPDITGQQGLVGRVDDGAGIAGVADVRAAIGLLHEPGPARTEVAGGGLGEGGLEGIDAAPLGLDRLAQGAGRLAAALGRQAVPVKGVVPDLGGIVEHAAARFADHVFQAQGSQLGTLDRL